MAHATIGAAGIEYIQGALKKPKKQNGHKHGNYLIMTHRTAPTTNPNCQRIYSKPQDAYTRTTPVTADEQVIRTRFKKVSKAVAVRRKDLNHVATDLAAFKAQKDTPNGKKTLLAYLWMVVGDAYDANPNDAMFQG